MRAEPFGKDLDFIVEITRVLNRHYTVHASSTSSLCANDLIDFFNNYRGERAIEPSDSDTLRKLADRFDAVEGFWQLPELWKDEVISIGAVRALRTLAKQLDHEHDGMIP